MGSHEQFNGDGHDPQPRGGRFDLWFYQQRGQRYYLRITRFGLIIFILFIIVPITALLVAFAIMQRSPLPMPRTDVHITPYPTTNAPVLQLPPPAPLPTAARQPKMAPPPTPPKLDDNDHTNEQVVPGQTPQKTQQTPRPSPTKPSR